jgi:hypothetical protein
MNELRGNARIYPARWVIAKSRFFWICIQKNMDLSGSGNGTKPQEVLKRRKHAEKCVQQRDETD